MPETPARVTSAQDCLASSGSDHAGMDQRTIRVELGPDSYPIHIGPGLIGRTAELIRPLLASSKVLVVADETVWKHHGERLVAALKTAGLDVRVTTFPA